MFKRLFCLSVGAAFLAAVPLTPLYAGEESVMEEIVVTGSRIARTDLEGAAAVTILSRETLEYSGKVSLGEFLREQPFVAGQAQTTSINNGGIGAERISLRGMGAVRTLVLVNGRRIVGSGNGASTTALTGTVDLNTIPMSIVERVEVLKDGASAVYGSDAVAGVVNIITRKDFSGVEFSATWGETSESDGARKAYSMTFGDDSELGHFVFNGTYQNDSEISAGDRSWAEVALGADGGVTVPSGSSAVPWSRATLADVTLCPGAVAGTDTCTVTRGPELGAFREYVHPDDTYNFAPINHQTMPSERWMLTFEGDIIFEPLSDTPIADEVRIFAETQYIHSDAQAQFAEVPLAPLAFFGFAAPYSAANVFNPFGEEVGDWRRRVTENGGRIRDWERDTKRVVVGMEGERGDWGWEFYYNYGRTDVEVHFGDVYNLDRVALAVGPTGVDAVTGDPTCLDSGGGVIAGCVPLDVFSGAGGITPEMVDYLTFTTNEGAMQSMEAWAANVTNSSVYDMPAGPLGFAAGWAYREYEGKDTPDSQIATLGDAATGTPRQETSGGYDVVEFYGEVVVPLVTDKPGAKYLEFTAAFRYSDYDTFGDDTTTKFGLLYRPFEDLLLRGTRSEAFRAPNISDLFGGRGNSFPSTEDPCNTNPTAFCIADGVPAAGFVPISQQVRTVIGGNPNVGAETADTWTYGMVWTPTGLDLLTGFSLSVDFFDITIEDAISDLGTDFILQSCAATGGTCNLIDRFGAGANEGNPLLVNNTQNNVGEITGKGMDVEGKYRGIELPRDLGMIDISVRASWLDEYDKEQADGTIISHAGRFIDDQDGYFTEWRANLDVTYMWRDLLFNYTYRYIGEADEQYSDGAFTQTQNRTIRSMGYHDVYTQYGWKGLTFSAGLENMFDEEPPLSLDGFNDNTDVRTFDTRGRYYYFAMKYNL